MTVATDLAEHRTRRSFVAADVQRIARITYRQLDYWTRTGVVDATSHAATGSGDVRWYRDTDVVRIACIAALLNAGVSLSAIREHIDQLLTNRHIFLVTDDVTITVDVDRIRARVDSYRRST